MVLVEWDIPLNTRAYSSPESEFHAFTREVCDVNYPETKDFGASWAAQVSLLMSPHALIPAVPAVFNLLNLNERYLRGNSLDVLS